MSLTLFYQAMSQCKALYKDNAETIMGNMDSIVFLGGREASTLKDISENLSLIHRSAPPRKPACAYAG